MGMTKREWNDDIDWLLNSAPGLLGERGVNQDPSGGSGQRFISDTGPMHSRMIAAIPHVQRQRRLNRVWRDLRPLDRAVLEHHYRPRRLVGDPVLRVAFGELAPVVCALSPDPEKLRSALRSPHTRTSQEVIRAAKKEATRAVELAHKAWVSAATWLVVKEARD